MNYLKTAVLLLLFVALTIACDNKEKKSIEAAEGIKPMAVHDITVYGSENCDHCIDFRKKVDSVGVKYTFKDVEASEQFYNELTQKIQQAQYKGYVSFPVLEIDGKLYVKPELDEFMKIVSE